MRKLLTFFVLSNLYVSFCVATLAFSFQYIYSSFNINVILFLFASTFISYNFHRIIIVNNNHKHKRRKWVLENYNYLRLVSVFSILIMIVVFFKFQRITQVLVLIISLISFLYPFFLRKIPYIKIFVIAFVWAFCTNILTFVENSIVIDRQIFISFFKTFLFVIAITIPFDIRDIRFDDLKMKTLPIVFGSVKSKKIAITLLCLCLLISVFEYLVFDFKIYLFISFFSSYIYSQYLIRFSSEQKEDWYFSFFVESASLSLLVFLIITSNFL